jgi:hypothetical protein
VPEPDAASRASEPGACARRARCATRCSAWARCCADGRGDDLKLTVSFAGIGAKRLVARYAGLELL